MKKTLITKELKVLPEQLQKRLLAQIDKDIVEIICINQKQSAQLLIVSVVLAKLVTTHEKQVLQNNLLIAQLYKQHNVIVCYGAHTVFPYQTDFHATYIALNMHPKFLVYSRTENSWRALFQNNYSFSVNKQLVTLEKYVAETVEHHQKTVNLFVTPLLKNSQFAAVGVICVQLLRNYLNMLQTMLFANGMAVVRSEQEMLVFLRNHYSELYRIFVTGDGDKLYLETILNENCSMLFYKEAPCSRLQKVLEGVREQFSAVLNSYFGKQLDGLIKPFENHRVFTRESYAEMVRQQVAQHLANGFGVLLIYHIETKHNNGNMELVLFLVVSAVTPYLEQRMVSEVANKFGSIIRVTLLLHRMGWISKHGYAHLPFIYSNITHEQLLFAKKDNMHAKFIFPVFEIPDGSFDRAQYAQYWDNEWCGKAFGRSKIRHNSTRPFLYSRTYRFTAGFYKKVCKQKNRIYTSGYHPSIHWRKSWYADLTQSEGLLRNSSDDSEFIVNNSILTAQNSLEIASKILSRCLHNLLQINVLYYTDYVPHTTNINTLIQLVRYAGENSEEFDRLVNNLQPVILLFDEDKNKQKKKTIRLQGEMLKHVQDFFKIISFA